MMTPERKRTPVGAEEKVNILLVDDQPGKLLGYEVILSELGENLIKAGSANEALEQLLKNDVAVVLIDCTSLPACGSVRPSPPRFSPAAMPGRK